tara:strand:- start:810 stop:1136 length:327 start_codon:yes stop_codon:yes gene_type:complete
MGGSESQYFFVDLFNDAPPPTMSTLEKEYIWNDLLNVINQKTYYISAEDIMEIVYKVILKESHTKSRKEMLSEIRKTIRHKEHIKWFQSIVWLKIFIDSLKPLNNCPN